MRAAFSTNRQPTIAALGLWHLGSVTAACCARHFRVIGTDADASVVESLGEGHAPVFEPGLDDLLAEGLRSGRLSFTADPAVACSGADVLWLTHDTPVNERDESDVESVLADFRRAIPHLPCGALVLVSAQLPVGTCARLESEFPQFAFACSPENLRLGKAIEAFEKTDRVVIGIRDESVKPLLEALFAPFAGSLIFVRTESAEMVKHALNSFLALSVSYINEIARLCEAVGADAREVSAGLKSDARIGPRAYLGPGGPFAGGTLARDLVALTRVASDQGVEIDLIPAIKRSNDRHSGWAFGRLRSFLGDLEGKVVAVLGLTYTPGTDTLRRSASIELCRRLGEARATVRAFDPAVKALPENLAFVRLDPDLPSVVEGADAVVVCTEWPHFREADWGDLTARMRRPLVVDANGFLANKLASIPAAKHAVVGRASS